MTYPIKKKYLTDENGKKTAVQIDIKTFDKLLDEIDDLQCALGYEEAREENAPDIKKGNFTSIEELIARKKKVIRKFSNKKAVK